MGAEGTIKGKQPEHFEPEMSAEKLHNSFKGLGTDEKAIIDVLTSHNNYQRQIISQKYVNMYGKELLVDLQDELGGHFLETCMMMMFPSAYFDAMCLRRALMVGSLDTSCLIDVLCTRTNAELKSIKDVYFEENASMLEQDLKILSGSHVGQILQALASANRSENLNVDQAMAEKDASDLISAGVSKIGLNGTAFNTVMCLRSRPQLEHTIEAYKKKTGVDLETDIRKEFTGDTQYALITLVKVMSNPVIYFAEKLYDCMKGSATDDETLIRLLISRSEIDLESIKMEYQQRYKTSLSKAIRDDCSGDYCRLLLKIVGES